ncbi:MAG TPA: prolyl oligopeptidase family serine peptidase [Steroidobacteraceae bacterium]|nr:prolyl oligopeptidase family serine peptidase [Steroidobacteraceae bacterium]
MKSPGRYGWSVAAVLACLLAACAGLQWEGARPMPGNGPHGTPLRTGSEVAVGLNPAPEHPPVYPVTATIRTRDHYHGVAVADDYRWLEDLDSDATRKWVNAQNQLAQPRLEAIPQRAWIKDRLTKLWNYERFNIPIEEGGRYFFLHNDGSQNQSVLFVSDSLDSPGRVLFDPNAVRADATVALSEFKPSPHGDLVAYALSDGGTDWQTWKFRRVADGNDLADTLSHTKFWGVSWAHDGSGVYYSRYPALPNGKGDDAGRPAIYFHRLGEPQDQDHLIYAVTDHPTRIPSARVTEDGHYLVITLFDGYERNGISLLDLRRPGATVQPLFYAWDALYTFIGSQGEELFFQTTKDAPQRRVIAVDARRPAWSPWPTVIPEQRAALEEAVFVGGRIIARYVEDVHSVVRIYERGGRPAGIVTLPGLGHVEGFEGKSTDAETFFSYTDYLTPSRIYRYDIRSNTATVWRSARIPASTDEYVTEQVFYPSKDGTRIPMFITHRRDVAKDGNQPVLLYGYGGFNISLTPVFRPSVLAWLEMGGIYAEANLRGGGEYGEIWHKAGTLESKQNVFDDFIAAAQYLINEHYTRSQRLGIHGRSNGGLLIGAVMTQRPELFGVALPAVGVLDMLRYQTASANARQWSSDYGLSEDAEQFRALYAYSPYHNVKKGVCYPPTLITTADHDDRVAPWHSYKFAAALQAVQVCGNPVLIRVETRAGHGAGKPVSMQIEDIADQWAFAAKALGMSVPAGTP